LLLGGTGEALALARKLAGDMRFNILYSVAGRTRAPLLPEGAKSRSGGFGGAAGLAEFLKDGHFDLLVDATHPFAAQISANAAAASASADIPLLSLRRPGWTSGEGDRWERVADMETAAGALGLAPRRVLLTIGQLELAPFRGQPQHHYVIRSVEPPPEALLPPSRTCLTARGPFVLEGELELLTRERIDCLVTKNSGGSATEAKLAAARQLGLPVIMVERPLLPAVGSEVISVEAALDWLDHFASSRPMERGV
jgi:precorrin-6A/cobalt-precorrin-6A reductase